MTPGKDILQKASVRPSILSDYISDTLRVEDKFKLESLVTVSDMFNARLHLGHKIGTLNNNMKWALYGERLGVCVFDLDITRSHLMRALNFVAHVAMRGGLILFVTTNRDTMFSVEKTAEEVEAAKVAIPTVGVVDSNSDPAYLTYLVPANDDTPQSVEYLLRLFKEAIIRGKEARKT
ncbi:putative ribosomal protein S2 [Necator americanus]|uniref:Putative ribosomal protein S2 n=1 Tax=Necator americanus TaxID=51031 RepID=W2TB47_NECAM|nr:putative ribosomal protein S2 [Necator americanus]ETN78794.1 putative ribosomal protein S2 [Necator americanus]